MPLACIGPGDRCWERGGVEGAPKASSATSDMTLTSVFAAVGRGLLSADTAELGHPDDQGNRGAFTNTRNAHDEIKSNSQIVAST